MAKHQFAVGDSVRLTVSHGLGATTQFRIVRLVPGDREDLPPAYRIKALTENHERMVKEDEIAPSV